MPKNKIRSTQTTDLTDIHFKPKHKTGLGKSVTHREGPHDQFNALEQFIKGEPIEPFEYEETRGKHSSISPSPYQLFHPSRTRKHSNISDDSTSQAKGSRTLLPEATNRESTDVTDRSKINEFIQRDNTKGSDLGKGYISSMQEDVVTETVKSLQETGPDPSKHGRKVDRENTIEKERLHKLKSQVHSITQDDNGEYEYGEEVMETENDMYNDNDDVTQGNTVDKHAKNHTSVKADSSMEVAEQQEDTITDETPEKHRDSIRDGTTSEDDNYFMKGKRDCCAASGLQCACVLCYITISTVHFPK